MAWAVSDVETRKYYVRAETRNKNPPFDTKTEVRTFGATDEESAKERFEYVLNSEGYKVDEWIGVTPKP